MKIFLVWRSGLTDDGYNNPYDTLRAIFSTMEGARQFIDTNGYKYTELWIEETEIDSEYRY